MKPAYLALLILSTVFGASICIAQDEWPDGEWPSATPSDVGLDADVLAAFDADIESGQYGYVDSMLVIRHGKLAWERSYEHDYRSIYEQEARTPGPLVVNDPSGPYNYFNAWWHPYYREGSLHTMQSVTKSVVSAVIGIAVGRGDFPAIDTPVLSFFEPDSVANVDERKRRMTLRHLLTMSTGLEWNEDVPYADPTNTFAIMAVSPDWVQFTMDRKMVHEPGDVYQYNSGATLVLGHVFRLATGIDLEEYAVEHLFKPLGISEYFWKRTPTGLIDTQEGLFVTPRDIARIAYLFLKHGRWGNTQVVPEDWVKASIEPSLKVLDDGSMEYGYKWWLYHYEHRGEDRVAFAGAGFGGQRPIVLPELDMVLVYTGWTILPGLPYLDARAAIERVLEAVK